MSRKKIEVIELNKVEEEIILEKKQSPLILFFKKYGNLLFLILFTISLLSVIAGIFLAVKNLRESLDPTIIQIDTSIEKLETSEINISGNYSLTPETAENTFKNSGKFKHNGVVVITKTITAGSYYIKYYSDGTALKVTKDGIITRINPLEDGSYGISTNGVINSKATTLDVTLKETKEYTWGIVNYYSDGSAEIKDSKIELYARNSRDINENYISNNKISYLKDTKKVGETKLNYYYDGTIEVIKNGKSYLVRNSEDLKITSHNVSFPNNNEAKIIKTEHLEDGNELIYYSDGGAIIKNGSRTISVRKSNSIIIKDNKIYEIVDNIYVEPIYKKGVTTYYTNGGATTYLHGQKIYVPENSNIKYNDHSYVTKVNDKYEHRTNETYVNGTRVTVFESTAIVETKEYTAIIPKDGVLYNADGTFKGIISSPIREDDNQFTITNNTKETIKYRVVIEKSDRTNLDVEYIRYQLMANEEYIPTTKLNNKIWQDDSLASKLSAKGTNYILIESTLQPFASTDINLMLWTDYESIPNTMQDKYFYGTIKVYGWMEEPKK